MSTETQPMSERPVEELIGWDMWRTGAPEWIDSNGVRHYYAEVDDMLEWLRLGGFHVQPGDYDFDLVDTPVRLLCVDAVRGSAFIDGDTMRQALEAVVRAVATDE